MGGLEFALLGIAAIAAGIVNALAGGGTLITFPMLAAVGLPAVAANMTSTVALCPGYLGAAFAQAADLRGQGTRLRLLLPAGAAGGLVGALLLLRTEERSFKALVPLLILFASALLAMQARLSAWVARRSPGRASPGSTERWGALPVGLSAVYGGYFGAGLSVIVLAVLGVALGGSLTRLNALKQAIAAAVNIAAAVVFLFSGEVAWAPAVVMAAGALVGGAFGGRIASRVRPEALRWSVVAIGVVVAALYLAR